MRHLLGSTTYGPLAFALAVGSASPLIAQSVLPQGGSVAAGGATIGPPSNNSLTITQTSPNALINWKSYSIGLPNTVIYNQPSSTSATLNRVTGNTPSTIAGSLRANGQVYLVNPNGIAITSSGTVNVGGGFVASTLAIGDNDFIAGRRTFTGAGSSAAVSNSGKITVGSGGFVGLLGGTVSNTGKINVPLGKVGLGSGESITLDVSGDGFMQVAVPTAATTRDRKALVDVSGRITAAGGLIELRAATVKQAIRDVVNVSGSLSARSVSGRSGAIVLGGGAGGNVTVAGRLNTSAGRQARATNGGTIFVTGHSVTIADKASINATSKGAKGGAIGITGATVSVGAAAFDASGATGGGTIFIGGGLHGTGALAHAGAVDIAPGATLRADATRAGDGGTVVAWSDGATSVRGLLSAMGAGFGNGGKIETSGHDLAITGITVNASAPRGATGTWLLDPYNLTVSSAATTATQSPTGTWTSNAGGSIVLNTDVSAALNAGTNVVLQTSGTLGDSAGPGDVNVNGAVSWSANTTLTLTASNSVNINANITAMGATAGLVINPNTASGGAPASGTGVFNLNGASVTLSGASPSLSIAGMTYTVINSLGAAVDATTAPATPTLQGMASANLAGHYALGSNIDATATLAWNSNAGFTPIGSLALPFTGTFDGLGNTIGNLKVNLPANADVGLFGSTGSASTIRNVGLVGGSVIGLSSTGGLVGSNTGTVSNSYNTGTVSGGSSLGGLMGSNTGAVSNSYATGAVNGTSSLGGLMGSNTGTVSYSYALGNVSGTSSLGGLMGSSTGPVNNSYASGNVSGTSSVGGLMGSSTGSVSNTYATGNVTGTSTVGGLMGSSTGTVRDSYETGSVTGTSTFGGLMGSSTNTVTDSYWNTQTSGQATSPGGTGLTSAQMLQSANFNAWDFANTWTIYNGLTNPLLQSFMTPVTVTANDATKSYDGQPFSGGNGVTYSTTSRGALLGAVSYGGASQGAINAGNYAIVPGGLYSNQQGYIVSYGNGTLMVTAAPLTVTADAQSRVYGNANPTLSYVSSGLVNGDTLSGLLATTATTTSNVGPYAITQGTLAATSNYALTYGGANLTVTAAAIPVPVAPPIVTPLPFTIARSTQLVAFPSYFTSNEFLGNDNGFASVNFAADPDASTCTTTGILRSLNRYGRVDLTGENAASCNAASHK